MLAELKEPYLSDDTSLLALCIWREARGCNLEAKLGVAWTIRNRCAQAPGQGFKHDVRGNILKPYAFSSFLVGDPNATKYPDAADSVWQDCIAAARSGAPDPTGGAVFYFSRPLTAPPHTWGNVTHTADIDGLHFYKVGA